MDVFDSHYYYRIKKFMTFCGHWPYMSFKKQVINQTLLMLAVLTIVIPQTAKLLQLRHNFHNFILAVPSMFYYVEFICKSFFATRQRKEIKMVLEKIKHDFQILKDDDLKTLQIYAENATKANGVYFTCMFTVVSAYSLVPLTLHLLEITIPGNVTLLRGPPRLITYFSESLDNNVTFIIIHGFVVDIAALVIMVSFDTLTFSFAYHVCGLFVVVSNKLHKSLDVREVLNKNKVATDSWTELNYKDDHYYKKLMETIILHKWTLEFVKILESALSILNLLSIGCALVPLTIAEYGVLANKGNINETIRFCIFVFGEIGHSIYYNWPGQQIKDHSLLVHQTCYDCDWYRKDVPEKCKKLLLFMMITSQKACTLSAGKVYVLGLENFGAILKLSMSYFTVLSSIM